MTEFTEAEIARAIGILRTNGMKLEQVLANGSKPDLTIPFNKERWSAPHIHIYILIAIFI